MPSSKIMPVDDLAQHFSETLGAPTKELYSMAGLVFLADFFGWNAHDAVEAYIFRSDVQYALNLEPGVTLSTRTLERYQQLFRDNDLAAASSTRSPRNLSTPSTSTSPASDSTRPTSSATWPPSAEPSSWPWPSSDS